MTDYTIQTNFGAKDSLPSGNAAKVVKGSEFTTEFTNIATAVNSKADTAGDTFTGAVNFSADVAVNTNTLFVDVSENKVGIFNTSPDSLLHVGTQTKSSTTKIKIENATGYAPTLEFNQSGTGAASIAIPANTNALQFNRYNGSTLNESMRLDASGNLGIGTTSPDGKLDIEGDFEATKALVLNNTKGTGKVSYIRSHGADGEALSLYHDGQRRQVWDSRGYIAFEGTDGAEDMRIDSSGNVGIGGGTISSKLFVNTDTVGDSYFRGGADNSRQLDFSTFATASPNAGHKINATSVNGEIAFATGGSEKMRINSSGNVGIGTDSPAARLDVKDGTALGTTNGNWRLLSRIHSFTGNQTYLETGNLRDSTGVDWQSAGTRIQSKVDATFMGWMQFNGTGNRYGISFGTGLSTSSHNSVPERMRIDSSGNVLVGTTSATANAKLKVAGAAILDDSVTYTKNYGTLSTTGVVVAKATGGNNGSSTTFIFTGQGGTGTAFHIIYAARNQGGQWSAVRSEMLGSGAVDVVASTSGSDVLFTFKGKSTSQGYSPKVKITTVGSNYDTTYLA